MAVVLPGKFIFLAHPHTASTAMMLAFQDAFPEAYDIRPHHMRLEELKGPNGATRIQQINRQRARLYDRRPHKRSPLQKVPEIFTGNETVFCVVRNPYDFFASRYARLQSKESFESFTRSYNGSPYVEQGQIYYHVPDSNRVLRYENLQPELDDLMRSLDLPAVVLERHNETQGKKPWESYYTLEAFANMNERFRDEFQPFYDLRTS